MSVQISNPIDVNEAIIYEAGSSFEILFKMIHEHGVEDFFNEARRLDIVPILLELRSGFHNKITSTLLKVSEVSRIKEVIEGIIGLPVASVRVDKVSNTYFIFITVNASASSVLRKWLEVADKLKGANIVFEWAGETDIEPEELGRILGMIFAKQGIYLTGDERFDVVKLLEEEWR
jgi:hypothetical protein